MIIMIEFDGFIDSWSHTFGTRSPILGWSGSLTRNWSNLILKSSTDIFVLFLITLGRQLKSLGPRTWKLWSLIFLVAGDPFRAGMMHSLPLRSFWMEYTPQFGTSPSSTFQVYIMLYRSARLSWEYILRCFILSHDGVLREGYIYPNIDSIIIEICVLYLELRLTPCFNIANLLQAPLPRNITNIKMERLVGNSLTNSYRDPTINYTLNQYPWACSLRTAGYRGRHVCGASLLSAPPSKTIIVTAAHCNYICKSSDGKVRQTCCCRNPADNFASCRTVIMAIWIHFI